MPQGYLFPRIFRRPNTGIPIRGKTSITAPDMTKALKVHARNAGEETHRVYLALLQIRRSTYTGASKGEPAYGNATRILEEAEYGLEIPQTHGSTDPRICRKLDGSRGIPRNVQRN